MMTKKDVFSVEDVAKAIDHAVLKPQYVSRDIEEQAAMCMTRGVGCICVRPTDVGLAVRCVSGSTVAVASVVGFPHGTHDASIKLSEAKRVLSAGAQEIDMVLAIGHLISGDVGLVEDEITAIVNTASEFRACVKVILETCYLSTDQIITACQIAEKAGANFVKTSTGFGLNPNGTTGATVEDVQVMLDTVSTRVGVKASGGIRSWEQAIQFLAMGCQRLGVGDAETILDGGQTTSDY